MSENRIDPSTIDEFVPFGLCHCGCGQLTAIGKRNYYANGLFAGQPARYIPGHHLKAKPRRFDAGNFKIDGVYCRLIPLTKGMYAIVDESDYDSISTHKWQATYNPRSRTYYASRYIHLKNGKSIYIAMHREIMGLDPDDPREIDHIELERGFDNRRLNLRICDNFQQGQNKRAVPNLSGYKGVSKIASGRYQARIKVRGKAISLGAFDTPESAYMAYCVAAKIHFGEFARVA